ncbi:MAG: hypothetical protein KOO63_05245, partial [Bacteroidales bacterium]|nr:hypothetical protein [Candidatus Latescibacterota bacterium]
IMPESSTFRFSEFGGSLRWDFDSRVLSLTTPVNSDCDSKAREMLKENKDKTIASLVAEFGEDQFEAKKANFIDLGPKKFSVLGFHNRFYEQARRAFVVGAYYPSLVGACALGERILNHLLLALRDDYRSEPSYKKVYRKSSFDDWALAIDTLEEWGVLEVNASDAFRALMEKRHSAIHFRPETDTNDRQLALEALQCLGEVIAYQFAGAGLLPWFLNDIAGEVYIRQEWEKKPFIQKVYLHSCARVGPWHEVVEVHPKWKIRDRFPYEDREISDDEFVRLRKEGPSPS